MGQAVVRYQYRWHQRLANQLLDIMKSFKLPIFSLKPESIIRAACRQTKMTDFGDERCLMALEQLMQIAETVPLSALGRVMTRSTCVKAMVNRLWMQHWKKTEPKRFGQLERPLFIVGLPRTGTTVLQNLIACDPSRRALPFWEILTPCPIVEDMALDKKRRMRMGRQIVHGAYYMAPEQRFIHQIAVDSVEECWPILFNTYAVLNFELAQGFDGWASWLLEHCDMNHSYSEYRQFLELCQGRQPEKQLILKCPEHLWFLDELSRNFSDAELVWTHRRLEDVLPSYASLISLSQRTLRGKIDPHKVGERLLPLINTGLNRGIDVRNQNKLNICDIAFRDICRDPISVVHQIYTHFGREVTEPHEKAMRMWLANRKSDARGAHTYELQTWGFKQSEVEDTFRRYHTQYADFLC